MLSCRTRVLDGIRAFPGNGVAGVLIIIMYWAMQSSVALAQDDSLKTIAALTTVVSADEWKKVLANSGTSNADLVALSIRLIDDAAALRQRQDLGSVGENEFWRKQLLASVLSWYVLERNPEKGNLRPGSTDSIVQFRDLLQERGIDQSVYEKSLESLAVATGFSATQEKISRVTEGRGTLSVIGIVPGLSMPPNVGFALNEEGFVIGGYALSCRDSYGEDGTLDELRCIFGESLRTRDLASTDRTVASNLIVYLELRAGFEKKFGPAMVKESEVQTGLGVKFRNEVSSWTDKQGNKLEIHQMIGQVDTGGLFLTSAKKQKSEQREQEQADSKRRF